MIYAKIYARTRHTSNTTLHAESSSILLAISGLDVGREAKIMSVQ